MKLLVTILITALLAWLTSWLIAWWMIAVIPFLVAVVMKQRPGRAFVSGSLSIALLWAVLVIRTDMANDYLLSSRMAQLFSLGHTGFIIVNIFVGALVGGLGGWAGACMRGMYKDKQL